uniref:Global nitrogen transcriptional regulator n=1 Tax=Sonderella linearis TaxID=110477 RepID=A0A1Z1MMP6_9FLOR|nr:global nitrogen transcriptional regulator [Sonderella linearis]ARW67122.1 global nitrogen transcriptional regulator [Sonderella linearis]
MKWINFFVNQNIPHYIYKLNKNDIIIINRINSYTEKSIIILYGSLYIINTFTNQEELPLTILNKNNIFDINNLNTNYRSYYQLIALEKTYIISFQFNHIKNIKEMDKYHLINIINSYQKTINKYETMNKILSHKYIKNRLIQLILFLFLEFGNIHGKQIYIPFKISQKNLAIITGTNKTTINKVMKYISKTLFINYAIKNTIHINDIYKININ